MVAGRARLLVTRPLEETGSPQADPLERTSSQTRRRLDRLAVPRQGRHRTTSWSSEERPLTDLPRNSGAQLKTAFRMGYISAISRGIAMLRREAMRPLAFVPLCGTRASSTHAHEPSRGFNSRAGHARYGMNARH